MKTLISTVVAASMVAAPGVASESVSDTVSNAFQKIKSNADSYAGRYDKDLNLEVVRIQRGVALGETIAAVALVGTPVARGVWNLGSALRDRLPIKLDKLKAERASLQSELKAKKAQLTQGPSKSVPAVEPKPEVKPADAKPADAKPADAKVAESKVVSQRPKTKVTVRAIDPSDKRSAVVAEPKPALTKAEKSALNKEIGKLEKAVAKLDKRITKLEPKVANQRIIFSSRFAGKTINGVARVVQVAAVSYLVIDAGSRVYIMNYLDRNPGLAPGVIVVSGVAKAAYNSVDELVIDAAGGKNIEQIYEESIVSDIVEKGVEIELELDLGGEEILDLEFEVSIEDEDSSDEEANQG